MQKMKFKEIEFKYDACDINLGTFSAIVETLAPSPFQQLVVGSYDDYFVNHAGEFVRYRHNHDAQELTTKRKVCDQNNNERIEVNLKVVPQTFSTVETFLGLLGYTHNFRIYKFCKIYWVENVVVCYYIVYDEDLTEQRRFVEIEANEDLEFSDESAALEAIEAYEDKLSSLGIDCKKRLTQSLFEMFRKNTL